MIDLGVVGFGKQSPWLHANFGMDTYVAIASRFVIDLHQYPIVLCAYRQRAELHSELRCMQTLSRLYEHWNRSLCEHENVIENSQLLQQYTDELSAGHVGVI